MDRFRAGRVGAVALALLAGGSLVGCSESTALDGTAREAGVIEQIVREVSVDVPGGADGLPGLPVVFVVGVDGTIGIEVQAGVAERLADEVDVRFADERIEAIDESSDDLPVREGGVLVVLDDIPSEGRTFEMEFNRYRTAEDRERLMVSFQWRSEQWTVTSTTVLPPATVPPADD